MKKKRIDLTGAEIMKICDTMQCDKTCCLRFSAGFCLAYEGVKLFLNSWINEEIEVEDDKKKN